MPIHTLGTILAGAELSKLRTVDSLEFVSRIVVEVAYRPKASPVKKVIAEALLSLRGGAGDKLLEYNSSRDMKADSRIVTSFRKGENNASRQSPLRPNAMMSLAQMKPLP